jgi:hypothetical protein
MQIFRNNDVFLCAYLLVLSVTLQYSMWSCSCDPAAQLCVYELSVVILQLIVLKGVQYISVILTCSVKGSPKVHRISVKALLDFFSEVHRNPVSSRYKWTIWANKKKTTQVPNFSRQPGSLNWIISWVAFITYPAPGTGISTSGASEPRPAEAPNICSSGLCLAATEKVILSTKML